MNANNRSSKGSNCFVIAEAGSNHNGSLEIARRLIDVAVDAGADAVKFQIFRAKTMYPKVRINVKYLQKLGVQEGLYDLIQRYEVPAEWIPVLASYCDERGIEFMATPFDLEAVRLLDPHVKRFKIATYENGYGDLIRAAMQTGKPLILSVGAMTAPEMDALFEKVLHPYLDKTTILQCNAKYPAPIEAVNMGVLPWIRERYGVKVGFSDHTADPLLAPIMAVALGATALEKHYTLSRTLPGPDHSFAVEPHELKQMVSAVRAAESALGKGQKVIHPVEKELYYYKRAYYLTRSVPAGRTLRESDLQVLRNTGRRVPFIHPLDPTEVIGKKLTRAKQKGDILLRGDV